MLQLGAHEGSTTLPIGRPRAVPALRHPALPLALIVGQDRAGSHGTNEPAVLAIEPVAAPLKVRGQLLIGYFRFEVARRPPVGCRAVFVGVEEPFAG